MAACTTHHSTTAGGRSEARELSVSHQPSRAGLHPHPGSAREGQTRALLKPVATVQRHALPAGFRCRGQALEDARTERAGAHLAEAVRAFGTQPGIALYALGDARRLAAAASKAANRALTEDSGDGVAAHLLEDSEVRSIVARALLNDDAEALADFATSSDCTFFPTELFRFIPALDRRTLQRSRDLPENPA